MSDWDEAAKKLQEEGEARRKYEAESLAAEEQIGASRFERLREADDLVGDFLLSASSVRNPGATRGGFCRRLLGSGQPCWTRDDRSYHFGPKLYLELGGVWNYSFSTGDPIGASVDQAFGNHGGVLYDCHPNAPSYRCSDDDLVLGISNLQRLLVMLMRDHDIPLPG